MFWYGLFSEDVNNLQNFIEYRMEVYLAYRTDFQLSQKSLKMLLYKRKSPHFCTLFSSLTCFSFNAADSIL